MNISVRFSQGLSILLFSTSLLVSATPSQAQPFNRIDGFGLPRSSEQFFLEGLERLEQEIDALQDGTDTETDILVIDASIEEQRQRIEQQGMSQEDWTSANTAPSPSSIPD